MSVPPLFSYLLGAVTDHPSEPGEIADLLEHRRLLQLLQELKGDEDVILGGTLIRPGASIGFRGVAIPESALYPIEEADLIEWNPYTPEWKWEPLHTGLDGQEGGGEVISPQSCVDPSSVTLKSSEVLFYYRPEVDHRELTEKVQHLLHLYYDSERKAYCRRNRDGKVEEIVKTHELSGGGYVITIKQEDLHHLLVMLQSHYTLLFDVSLDSRWAPEGCLPDIDGRPSGQEGDTRFWHTTGAGRSRIHGFHVISPDVTPEIDSRLRGGDFWSTG